MLILEVDYFSGVHISLDDSEETIHIVEINDNSHGLRTSNEGINQSYLKNWADVAGKICFGRT